MGTEAAPDGVVELISGARLKPYVDRYQGNRILAMRRYTWNLAVSSAFWGPICVLEVALRNALHAQLVDRAGASDWWNNNHIHLCAREREAIDSAIDKLRSRGNGAPSSDDVVAATSFGLWTGLLSGGIPRDRLLDYETTLWQPRLQRAFPYRGTRRRKYIHAKLDRVRDLRNRIAHHEPIHRAPQQLATHYDSILELAGMLDPGLADFIREHSRTARVIAQERQALTTGDIEF